MAQNGIISAQSPATYVPRLRERLNIDDQRWGRMCAQHALPIGWERMEYRDFLPERRRRMADVIRVAFRQLGGETDASLLTPPWFTPGAEEVWKSIGDAERSLRQVLRVVYSRAFGDKAAQKIELALPERERDSLTRALRARPTGFEQLSIVDYLYLAQIPPLLFSDQTSRLREKF